MKRWAPILWTIVALVSLSLAGCKKTNDPQGIQTKTKTTPQNPTQKASKQALSKTKARPRPKAPKAWSHPLLRFIPKHADDILILRKLGALPPRLDAFLTRLDGQKKGGRFRQIVAAWKFQLGLDPLDPKSLSKAGLSSDSAAFLVRLKMHKRPTALLALSLKNPAAFRKLLHSLAKQKLLVSEFRKQKGPLGTIVTAYGRNDFEQPVEEFAYFIHKQVAIITADLRPGFKGPSDKPKYSTWSAKTLTAIAKARPQTSFLNDKRIAAAFKQWRSHDVALYFRPNQVKRTAAQRKALLKNIRQATSLATSRPNIQRNTALLLNLRSQLPWQWSALFVSPDQSGIRVHSHLKIDKDVAELFDGLQPKGGQPKKLLQTIHKKAIATLKLSLQPAQLDVLFRKASGQFSLDPKRVYALLKQITKIDIQKDVIPGLTGHAYVALYHVNSNLLTQIQRRHPLAIPGLFELAIVAQIKDTKRAKIILEKLAKSLKIGTRVVKRIKDKKDKTFTQYWIPIPAWPGVIAHWTVKDNVLIYSIGPRAIRYTLQAIKDKKQRLFSQAPPETLATQEGGALYLNIPNLKNTIGSMNLSFTLRLLIANFFTILKNVESAALNFQPQQQQIQIQGQIHFQRAAKP